jgi:hypothetical protein
MTRNTLFFILITSWCFGQSLCAMDPKKAQSKTRSICQEDIDEQRELEKQEGQTWRYDVTGLRARAIRKNARIQPEPEFEEGITCKEACCCAAVTCAALYSYCWLIHQNYGSNKKCD